MKIIRFFLLLLILIINTGPSLFSLSFFDDGRPEDLAAAIEKAMTDEQALAQVFMLGWLGSDPSPLVMNWIRQRQLGGVKVFGWNTDNTVRLARAIGTMQGASLEGPFGIPLLVATDQEGGWIRHVKGNTSETPGNMAIGATGYPRDAYLSGYYIGRELSVLGINMNFAPTVDLFTNRASWLISTRSFGDNPVNVGILGAAFSRGQLDAGIIPTAKHFPGHGDTELDSHGVLPRIYINYDTLWNRELIPYRMLIAEKVPAIMSAHIAFPRTPAGGSPASLSRWFLHDVLRGEMGFQGIVVTDDLIMNGATIYGGPLSRTAKRALEAGNDILLISQTPELLDPVWTVLLNSMASEPEFRARVRESTRRTIEIKLRYLRGDKAVPFIPDLQKVETNLPDPEGRAFFLDHAVRSVTITKPAQLEGSPTGAPVFPITPENAGSVLLTGQSLDFFRVGRAAFPGSFSYWYSERFNINDLLSYANRADTIIFMLTDSEGVRILQRLQTLGKKIIVFSVLSPAYLDNVPWIDGAIAVYNNSLDSFAAGFSAITGRVPAGGKLPYGGSLLHGGHFSNE
jgi:beta-N-acetylhexosaminidase